MDARPDDENSAEPAVLEIPATCTENTATQTSSPVEVKGRFVPTGRHAGKGLGAEGRPNDQH